MEEENPKEKDEYQKWVFEDIILRLDNGSAANDKEIHAKSIKSNHKEHLWWNTIAI